MSKMLTHLASSIVFIAGIANASDTISTKKNTLDTACFSSLEKEGPIFISLSLDFDNPRRAGFIQYKNDPRIPLKFLSYEDLTAPGARLISYSYTYAEIVNKKITGYYTYTWQGGDVPSLVYLSKNRKKRYHFRIDSGAYNSNTPSNECNWSKSDLLDGDESK